MNSIFNQQMEVVRQTYDPAQDGRLELTIKFGELYVFQWLNSDPHMLVRDFNFGIVKQGNKRDPQSIRTSFVPTSIPNFHMESVLKKAGFREVEKEDVIVVAVDHSKSQPRITFEVILDENFKFISQRKADRSFVNIDIRREKNHKPDIRLTMKSVDEEPDKNKLDAPGSQYARDDLIRSDYQGKLMVNAPWIGKAYHIREKSSRIFKLHTASHAPADSVERFIAVKLIHTTSHENALPDGRFRYVKHENEVYIRITGKDELYSLTEDAEFMEKLMAFCDKF